MEASLLREEEDIPVVQSWGELCPVLAEESETLPHRLDKGSSNFELLLPLAPPAPPLGVTEAHGAPRARCPVGNPSLRRARDLPGVGLGGVLIAQPVP